MKCNSDVSRIDTIYDGMSENPQVSNIARPGAPWRCESAKRRPRIAARPSWLHLSLA